MIFYSLVIFAVIRVTYVFEIHINYVPNIDWKKRVSIFGFTLLWKKINKPTDKYSACLCSYSHLHKLKWQKVFVKSISNFHNAFLFFVIIFPLCRYNWDGWGYWRSARVVSDHPPHVFNKSNHTKNLRLDTCDLSI